MIMRITWGKLHPGTWSEYEQSDFFKQEIVAHLQPFFVGDFKTTYCEVKRSQEFT